MSGDRVLLCSYSGVLGGAERIMLDAAGDLEGALVACPEGAVAGAARAAGIAVELLPARPLRVRGGIRAAATHAAGLAGMARDLARLARDRRAGAVAAWGARAVLAAAALRRGRRPPLLAVHCDLVPRGAVGTAVRAATARADGVAALSHAIAHDVGVDGATILHPGVDLGAFTPAPLPSGPPTALVLGALVPWKRADLALDVAALVDELRLVIAGAPLPGDDGAFASALWRRAASADLRGRVSLIGALADPRPALAGAHCLLHCADAEPYGLALVEALAAGRPVAAPAAGGPLEIVAAGAGRLYRPGDARAAAEAVRAVLADGAAPAAARARAEAAFDVHASNARFAAAVAALTRRG